MPAYNSASLNIAKEINLSSDTFGVVLTNIPVVLTHTILSDLTQIVAGNGYTTDGPNVAVISWDQADVVAVAELVIAQVTFTAAGGPMAAFQYAHLYDKTTVNKYLISYYDYGSSKVLADGEAVLIPFDDGTNSGALRLGVGTIT